jgi:hypothetical protein
MYTAVYQQHETGHGAHLAFCIMRNPSFSWVQIDRCVALDIHTNLALKLKKRIELCYFILWVLMTCSDVPIYEIFNSSFHFEGVQVLTVSSYSTSDIK